MTGENGLQLDMLLSLWRCAVLLGGFKRNFDLDDLVAFGLLPILSGVPENAAITKALSSYNDLYSNSDGTCDDPAHGWGLVGAYAIGDLAIASSTAVYWDKVYTMVVRYRAASVGVIFDKLMRLSASYAVVFFVIMSQIIPIKLLAVEPTMTKWIEPVRIREMGYPKTFWPLMSENTEMAYFVE
ncbi:hypothetical protein EDD18DRAFT_1112006 [Armillaria luteobubalina]|uniref:Uncharacterized protein n=1 Tax=Armillaria luteobubalina TaxID=153913 RepID=A0AA39PH92_9AGAR|nr:hypothetical protein EDD18DRAFT_1112006 [Armillaria luteobubalina]